MLDMLVSRNLSSKFSYRMLIKSPGPSINYLANEYITQTFLIIQDRRVFFLLWRAAGSLLVFSFIISN